MAYCARILLTPASANAQFSSWAGTEELSSAGNTLPPSRRRLAIYSSNWPAERTSTHRSLMKVTGSAAFLISCFLLATGSSSDRESSPLFGFHNPAQETGVESRFLAVPEARLAEEHLRRLTQAPHIAGSPEDKATADYVAEKFRAAGLATEVVEYRVWMNYPQEISVDVTAPAGIAMHGPTREHVSSDPYQDDPRIVMPYNGMSPS